MNKILLIVIIVIFSASMVAIETNGYLSVESADGVEILVDGKLAGVVKDGQLFLELAAGNYEVTAQGYGFTSETIWNVKIEPLRATTLEIHLKEKVVSEQLSGKLQVDLIHKYEKYGTVRVFSIPFNGAQVIINGESYGETDIELSYFPAGQLSIEVEGPNRSKVTGVFFLDENSPLTLLADFIDKQIYQLYEVSFDFPDSAEMMIDNTKIARNMPSTFIGGTYSVELIAKNSSRFEGITRREIVISKSGNYYLEPDDKPVQEKMLLVEKSSFTMDDTWGDGEIDEKPTHKVTFTYDFYIGKYEITFDEYGVFCNATGRSKPNDWGWGRGSRPVIYVSWWDAVAYCNWLSDKEKLPKAYDNNGDLLDKDGRITTDPSKVVGYRLPTEAEWEYAARGGNKSKGYKYSGSDNVGDVAWYTSDYGGKTQEVGKKTANELGLYDMSGNVWEWCNDWYSNTYYDNTPTTNPYNSTVGSYKMIRGGGWYNTAANVRVANRGSYSPTYTGRYLGFRICRTVPYTESRPVQVSDSSPVAVYVNGTLNVISMDNTSGTVSVIRNPYQYQGKVSPVTNGDLIYMVDDTGRLVTLRVSGTAIETVSSLNTGTDPETLVLAGGYLWLLDTKSAAVVHKILLDNRGIPTRSESVFRDWTTPVDMFVSEDLSRIYLADALSGIKVLERSGSSYVDVSSRFTVSLNGYARSVVAFQDLVFSGEAGVDGGLKMIDLSRSVRSNLGKYYIVLKLLVSNNIVYAITDKGVSIIDISSPSQPVILRDIETSQVDEIRVSGRLLAVRAGDRLLIYDVLSAGSSVLLYVTYEGGIKSPNVPSNIVTSNNSTGQYLAAPPFVKVPAEKTYELVSITYALFSSGIEKVKLVAGTHEIISSGQRAEFEVDWPLDFDTVSIWAVLEDSAEFIGAARVTASSSSRNIPVVSESGETKGVIRIELE